MFDGGGEQLQQLMIRNSTSSSSSSPTTATAAAAAAARTSLTLPPPFISSPNNFHHHHVSSFFDPAPPHGSCSFLQYPPPAALSPHDLQPRKLDSGGTGGGFHLGMNRCMEEVVHDHHPWSTEELVALFRIRSTLYNWFPQFTWEHVSRKMAELGYKRSADKCKEKFELESRSSCNFNNNNANTTTTTAPACANNNNYRIFTELDELICHGDDDHNQDHPHHDHDHTDDDDDDDGKKVDNDDDEDQQKHMIPPAAVHTKPNKPTDQKLAMTSTADKDSIMMGQDLEQDTQNNGATTTADHHHALVNSNDDDGKLELDQNKNIEEGVKRKRVEEEEEEEEEEKEEEENKSKKKMKKQKDRKVDNKFEILKGLCEEMVKKLMAKQEEMHNKLIKDMVKRDEEKLKREEAWKKQEMERMKKELDARAKEQQIAGERQTTLLNFLSKLAAASSTDHHPTANNPPSTSSSSSSSLAVAQNPSTTIMAHTQQDQKPDHHHHHHHHEHEKDGRVHTSTSSSNLSDPHQLPKTFNQNPNTAEVTTVHHDLQKEDHHHHGGKRWPRDEVLALINIRCTLSNSSTNDIQDQTKDNAGSRAPLWERISQGMLEMGYKRSAKRCKEKWENINKYFRKTKDSSKKRSLDSRTCPYFHQLSTLYNQGKLSLPENHSDQPSGSGGGHVQSHEKHVADDQPAAGFDFEL